MHPLDRGSSIEKSAFEKKHSTIKLVAVAVNCVLFGVLVGLIISGTFL